MSSFNQQTPNSKSKARWNLLPSWIKFFTWIFLILSIIGIILSFIFFLQYGYFESNIYGLEKIKVKNISELALIINFLNFLVAYGYISQKDWAIKAGITNAIIGILICIFVIVVTAMSGHLNFRFEIIILLFYYSKLKDIKEQWSNIKM